MALEVQQLTNDIASVKKAVEGLAYLKGFTNMAQAFTAAEKMLLLGGRKKAQSAVLTLTDGKPSFLFQTHEKVMQLKDKHVKLFFAPIVEYRGHAGRGGGARLLLGARKRPVRKEGAAAE